MYIRRRRRRKGIRQQAEAACAHLGQTPIARLREAIRRLERLPLRDSFYNAPWRSVYVADMRAQAEELGRLLEAAADVNQRAVAELADLHYLYHLAFQIAKVLDLDNEPDILPMGATATGRYYAILGETVFASVLIGNDDRYFIVVQDMRAGTSSGKIELGDTGLTPAATVLITETISSPLAPTTTSSSPRG